MDLTEEKRFEVAEWKTGRQGQRREWPAAGEIAYAAHDPAIRIRALSTTTASPTAANLILLFLFVTYIFLASRN